MIYTQKIKDAIRFATKTHEVYQKQKRKGKDIPYLTHPFTVGLILARAGASEDVIVAGILHDTIEDSVSERKVSRDMLAERFGENVAELVLSVTEQNKELPWDERKRAAIERIENSSHDSLLVKSADILSNASELIDDLEHDGESVFARFNAPKEKILEHYLNAIAAIKEKWPVNPLIEDLNRVQVQLEVRTDVPSRSEGFFVSPVGKNPEQLADEIMQRFQALDHNEKKEELGLAQVIKIMRTLPLKEQLAILNKKFSLIPYVAASRLYSTVRRMTLEKELGIPLESRAGFAISVENGKNADQMSIEEWEHFYTELRDQLQREYPDLYQKVFSELQ